MSIPVLAAPERLRVPGGADMAELARAACARYGIAPEGRLLRPYPLTENWTYHVDDDPGPAAVLRVYRPHGGPWQSSVDDCGLSWYLYDLACALTFNEGRADVRELIALWVGGYRQAGPLSAADEAEIDTFLMLRRLMLTAYAGLRADTELAVQMRMSGYNTETCAIAEPYLSHFA